jgi:hypothetical protein
MEVYRSETDEIMRRFLRRQLTHEQCIVGLYDALASALPDFSEEDWPGIRAVVAANNETIHAETERRRAGRGGAPDPGYPTHM